MISIIIISKNEEGLLPKLLKSIKRQKNVTYEVILADAQSTDKTRGIAKNYGCIIVEGGLPSKGRNEGAKVAKYPDLLFLDSDVILPRGFLFKLTTEALKHKIDVGTVIYKPLTEKRSIKAMYWAYNKYARGMQYILPHAGGLCIFVKKEIFDKVGGFNEKMLICEDHDFVTRCAKIGKFRILKNIFIYSDVRRIENEGKLRFLGKYTKGGVYRVIFGDRIKPPFSYKLHGSDKDLVELYNNN